MGSSLRPEPEDNWLASLTQSRVQPAQRQLGPTDTFAPADASAVRTAPRQMTGKDYLHTARQIVGGLVEGGAHLAADAVNILGMPVTAAPEGYDLQTVGRGQVRSVPRTTPRVLPRAVEAVARPLEHAAQGLGDLAAGGAPQTVSDSSFRDIGYGTGNLLGGEALFRAPAAIRALRGRTGMVGALLENGGATLTRDGQRFAGTGFAVADPALTASFSTVDEAKAFLARPEVRRALDRGGHIGKWTDPATGVTEVNISDIIPDRKDALRLAAQRGEQAVGQLDNGQYIGDVANPHAPVRDAQALVRQMNGGRMLPRVNEVPREHGERLARAYEGLPKNDPAARGAYDALNTEVEQQFKAIEDAGFKIEFTDHDPYKTSADMMRDVRENRTLKVFRTPEDGFHPHMTREQNDRFRAVHDFIAHAGGGNQFGVVGEENAYRIHASTLSPEAQRALASETRGQNSWVNFGPNSHLPVGERPFAEQKAALFPEGLLGDYADFAPEPKDWSQTPLYSETMQARRMGEIPTPVRLPRLARAGIQNDGSLARPPLEAAAAPAQLPPGGHFVNGKWQTPQPVVNAAAADPVVAAAVRANNGEIFRAPSHGQALAAIEDAGLRPVGYSGKGTDLFATKSGKIITRAEVQEAWGGRRPVAELMRLDEPAPSRGLLDLLPTLDERGGLGIQWKPTPRGVFDRTVAPIQGTAPADARLSASMPRGEASDLANAVADSKVVQRGLQTDIEQGLPQGGSTWYETAPIRASIEEAGGPFSFQDFNNARGAGSIQNPTHNEVASLSGLLFGERQGLGSAREIQQAHQARYPHESKLWLSEQMRGNFGAAREAGAQLPSAPGAAERKVAWYTHGNAGGSPAGLPALDTHERRRLLQLAAKDKKIAPLLKKLKITNTSGPAADLIPITNGLDYERLSEPYVRLGQKMGLPSTQAAQAGRWIGGGKATGLKSQPAGDFVQTLEDVLLHTAQSRGLPTDPEGLRKLWQRILKGEDFATPLYGNDPLQRLYSGQGLLGLDEAGVVGFDQVPHAPHRVTVPALPAFRAAVEGTPGASITPDGLRINLERFQKEKQAGRESVRSGVFYLPDGSPSTQFYRQADGRASFGGSERIKGETVFQRPLAVQGETGGFVPEQAIRTLMGEERFASLRRDLERLRQVEDPAERFAATKRLLRKYGGDYSRADHIFSNSTAPFQLQFAIQENIAANAARNAGYDGIIGFNEYKTVGGKQHNYLSEIFDVRESHYPVSGEAGVLHPHFAAEYERNRNGTAAIPMLLGTAAASGAALTGGLLLDR